MVERHGLGTRVNRAASLAKLGAKAGTKMAQTRHAERRGDQAAVDAIHEELADAMVETLGTMKGAAMKIGQMLAFVDLSAEAETSNIYQQRLAALLDDAPPTDTDAIETTITEQFGAPADKVFARWDREPIAVASIGQVHRASLPDGTEVAVKVQHPRIAEAVSADLENLSAMRPIFAITHPNLNAKEMIEEVRERLRDELDYQKEAAYQQAFCDRFAGHPSVAIPGVHHEWCRPRVLVTDFVNGRKFDDVLATADDETRNHYGEVIFRFTFSSLYRFRIFNADPHPGNFLFPYPPDSDPENRTVEEYGKITFLDFGSSRTFTREARLKMRQLHLAVAQDNAEQSDGGEAMYTAMKTAGFLPDNMDGIDFDLVRQWFTIAYEPMAQNTPWTYTPEYARNMIQASTDPENGLEQTLRKLTMAPEYLMLNRIQFGVNSLLAKLQPTANWRAIMDEIATSGEPTTAIGKAEQPWLERHADLVETPDDDHL